MDRNIKTDLRKRGCDSGGLEWSKSGDGPSADPFEGGNAHLVEEVRTDRLLEFIASSHTYHLIQNMHCALPGAPSVQAAQCSCTCALTVSAGGTKGGKVCPQNS
jgi:hypothetical protein